MPRLKQKKPDPCIVRIQTVIDSGMHRQGLTSKKAVAELVGMPVSSFIHYYNQPDKFHVGDLRRILDMLGVPQEERGGCI